MFLPFDHVYQYDSGCDFKAVRDSFLDENCQLSTFIKIMSAY